MTRPTRRLLTIIESMPVFKKVAEGTTWDRSTQRKFEEELGKTHVKSAGKVREDSGGNRTWAASSAIFGLWYKDNGKVVLTAAAKPVLKGHEEAVKQIRHQLLRFQWPNRTQEHRSQKMDEGFRIFPYRFLFKLLLDPEIRFLTTSEIALFVLQTKTESEFSRVKKEILLYRGKKKHDRKKLSERRQLVEWHKKFRPSESGDSKYTTEKHLKYITDLANTFMNHMEFFSEIIFEKEDEQSEKSIRLEKNEIGKIRKMVDHYDAIFPLSPLYKFEEVKWFIENYGNRYDRTKASRKTAKPRTKPEQELEALKRASLQIMVASPSLPDQEIISKMQKMTGMNKNKIKKIITANPKEFDWNQTKMSAFSKEYLKVATDGSKNREFEEMTREIFRGMGFPTDKITETLQSGNQLTIDGFVQHGKKSGIIDAKSGKQYSLSNSQVGIMKDYISTFKNYRHNGTDFSAEFFAYVFGKRFRNASNFNRIIKQSGLDGSIISANELLKLKQAFDSKKISKDKIWRLFRKNGEISSYDY
ncbi:MAG: hypothetical protein GWN01_13485 [Nitrosopumilaceae archaeon]|nr:hypothetical protein [Nitrosopumilaceae archaeon]NIU01876.1 hypothetical protein [Nitrosopumilaceae archaeon]NIU88280.1 hypothetical protein [Nitrosopumilaceae archaeon]NIV66572.1 hypothetical protein [Nitrosopumilaceae archaeon]NIX62477.1 hypothetical protein [Nitrosopumilaceae archaeon]